MDLVFRSYSIADKKICMELFDSNSDLFFDPIEREEFSQFLDSPNCYYFVILNKNECVASAGYQISKDQIGSLCWGMVRRSHHRKGIGKELLSYRIQKMKESGVKKVVMDTSQRSVGFYHHFNFSTLKVIKDGYGKGLDQFNLGLIF